LRSDLPWINRSSSDAAKNTRTESYRQILHSGSESLIYASYKFLISYIKCHNRQTEN
jgi:effector-binding domain-containing protein